MAVPASLTRILIRLSLCFVVCAAVACADTATAPEQKTTVATADSTATSEAAPAATSSAMPVQESLQSLPPAVGQAPQTDIPINPRHPDSYVVQTGDTLWDIASLFLTDPWYWPEIWFINPQVANPHLIFPGDVLRLIYMGGEPRVVSDRTAEVPDNTVRMSPEIRVRPLEEAIPTIPYDSISAFLSRPTVLSNEQIDKAPYILRAREGHLIAGSGVDVYIRGAEPGLGERFTVIHVGDPLIDPDSDKVIGYEGIYVGEGQVTRLGDPATMNLLTTSREATEGDRLFSPDVESPVNFVPRAPGEAIEGRIIEVVDGVYVVGQYQIVVLNRGARDGLAPGHVLSVWQAGEIVKDRFARKGGPVRRNIPDKIETPEEHAGVLMVFKAYDQISYALIMHATSEMHVQDFVRTP